MLFAVVRRPPSQHGHRVVTFVQVEASKVQEPPMKISAPSSYFDNLRINYRSSEPTVYRTTSLPPLHPLQNPRRGYSRLFVGSCRYTPRTITIQHGRRCNDIATAVGWHALLGTL